MPMGTSGPDNYLGTSGNDNYSGLGGDDVIDGQGGNDTLDGGDGNDHINGDHEYYYRGQEVYGNDIVLGGAGDDVLNGGLGNDDLEGGDGNDIIYGEFNHSDDGSRDSSNDNDTIYGQAGNDTLYSNGGHDLIFGGIGDDFILGGIPFDSQTTAFGEDGNDIIYGSEGADVLDGGAGDDRIYDAWASGYGAGDGYADSINGGDGNDTIGVIGAGDTVSGGAGDDVVIDGRGASSQDGGTDNGGYGDTLTFLHPADIDYTDSIVVDLQAGQVLGDGFGNAETATNFESLGLGTPFVDLYWGSSRDNAFVLGSGDIAYGYAGNDQFTVQAPAYANGGDGYDRLVLQVLVGTNGGYTVDLAAGTYSAGGSSNTLVSIEAVTGSVRDDVIRGDAEDNDLAGGGGNNVLVGRGGDDTINAVQGSDIIYGGFDPARGSAPADPVTGDTGIDTLSYAIDHYYYLQGYGGVSVDLSAGRAQEASRDPVTTRDFVTSAFSGPWDGTNLIGTDSLSGIENLTGSGLADRLIGDAGANVIAPGSGDDYVDGGAGIDTLDYRTARGAVTLSLAGGQATMAASGDYQVDGKAITNADDNRISTQTIVNIENVNGSDFADSITGSNGVNLLDGGLGDDTLAGGDGDDTLIGGLGADSLFGGLGDDLLMGAYGNDHLYGGTTNKSDSGIDTVSYALDPFLYATTGKGGVNVNLTNGTATETDQAAVTSTSGTTTHVSAFTGRYPGTTTEATDVLGGIENVIGTGLNDWLTGTNRNNVFAPGSGNDIVNGAEGNDTVDFSTARGAVTLDLGGGTGSMAASGVSRTTYDYDASGNVTHTYVTDADDNRTSHYTLQSIENAIGTAYADTITGGDTASVLTGGAGDDTLYGMGGDDVLQGGAGNDTLDGGAGNDLVYAEGDGSYAGGADYDVLDFSRATGPVRADLSVGGRYDDGQGSVLITGFEQVNGSAYDDVLVGTAAAETLNGASGSDLIEGGAGDDMLSGGKGVDTVSYQHAGAPVTVDLSVGTATSAEGNDTLAEFENITGSAFADILRGSQYANLLDGGAGPDRMEGGAGDDSYIVDDAGDVVVEADGQGIDSVSSSVSFSLAGQFVENLTLTGSADTNATGNGLANVLTGNTGANTLNGGAGADVMAGGTGNDRYIVDNAGDTVTEAVNGGSDTVESSVSFALGDNVENLKLTGTAESGTGNGLANMLIGTSGANRLDGGAGADTMQGGKGDDIYWVDTAGDVVIEADGEGSDTINAAVSYSLAGQYVEVLNLLDGAVNGTGNSLNNRIVGNSAANTLVGGDGSDRLDGGAGADTMKGGLGNDVYVVDNALDKIVENDGEGTDTVEASFSYSIAGQYIEILKLMGTGDFTATGNGLANTIYGNAGANLLNGGTGADDLYGGLGNDTYVVDNAADRVFENNGEGTDTVQASVSFSLAGQYVENLTLTGTAAINGTGNGLANILTGNGAANALNGGAGNDALHGGLGSDTLTGGAGQDSYWFETALGAANIDTITDFSVADDTIILDRGIFTAITADGVLASAAFWQGTAAHDTDDRIVYDQASGDIWYDADGSGAGAAVRFAHVAANTALTAADFLAIP